MKPTLFPVDTQFDPNELPLLAAKAADRGAVNNQTSTEAADSPTRARTAKNMTLAEIATTIGEC